MWCVLRHVVCIKPYEVCSGTYHYTPYMPFTNHYTPHMPWYTPLHTLYSLVYATTHLTYLGTHLLWLCTYPKCFDAHHYTFHALVHTTCLCTHLCWYTPLHTLYALVHTLHTLDAFVAQCATPRYIIRNSTIKKDEHCTQFCYHNSNSVRLTNLKFTVNVVEVLMYLHINLQISIMCSFHTI